MPNGAVSAGLGAAFTAAGTTLEPIANALLLDRLKSQKLAKLNNAILDAQQALNDPNFIAQLKAEGFSDEDIERLRLNPQRVAQLAAGSFADGAIESGSIRPSAQNAIVQEGIDAGIQNQPTQATAQGMPERPSPLLADQVQVAPDEVTLDKVAPSVTIRGTRAEQLGPLQKNVELVQRILASPAFQQIERGIIGAGGTAADVNAVRERILSPAQQALLKREAGFEKERRFGLEIRKVEAVEDQVKVAQDRADSLNDQVKIQGAGESRKALKDQMDFVLNIMKTQLSFSKTGSRDLLEREVGALASALGSINTVLASPTPDLIFQKFGTQSERSKFSNDLIKSAGTIGRALDDRAQRLLAITNDPNRDVSERVAISGAFNAQVRPLVDQYIQAAKRQGVSTKLLEGLKKNIGKVDKVTEELGVPPTVTPEGPQPAVPKAAAPAVDQQISIPLPSDVKEGRVNPARFREGDRFRDPKTGDILRVTRIAGGQKQFFRFKDGKNVGPVGKPSGEFAAAVTEAPQDIASTITQSAQTDLGISDPLDALAQLADKKEFELVGRERSFLEANLPLLIGKPFTLSTESWNQIRQRIRTFASLGKLPPIFLKTASDRKLNQNLQALKGLPPLADARSFELGL